MGWLNKVNAVIFLLLAPTLVLGQSDNPVLQTSVEWYQIGELPVSTSNADQVQSLAMSGTLVGVHNNGLIVAGRMISSFPLGQQSSVNLNSKISYNAIWVATRDAGLDGSGGGEITPDERVLIWHDTKQALPGNWAYGASASHELGMIAIGGVGGKADYSHVVLIRWNEDTKQTSLLNLPMMPGVSVDGRAAVIGNTLYVMVGNNNSGPSNDLFSFDLSRIQTDEAGDPIADSDIIKITDKQDEQGRPVNPWQQLPSLPQQEDDLQTRTHMMVVAQNDGRGERLFVIGGHRASYVVEELSDSLGRPDEQQIMWREYSDIWVYNPSTKDSVTAWSRKADNSVAGEALSLRTGIGSALGQSHILVLGDPGSNNDRKALSYNTITNAWTRYSEVLLTPRSERVAGNELSTNSILTPAVRWGDDIILAAHDMGTRIEPPKLWAIQVRGAGSNFGWQNMSVLVIYLLTMVLIGVYFAYRNSDTNDYFRGGQDIPWWAAGCSMFATIVSSLTFVAMPALVYRTDWVLLVGQLTLLLMVPILIRFVLPFFRQLDVTSAYEYLSLRFNMSVRLFASGLFTIFHISRMGIVLALSALALAAVTPMDPWQSVLVMGILSMSYSTMGGIEAVIWTDTIQTVVMTIGAVICFAFIIGGIDGGFSGYISSGMTDNKFKIVNWDFGSGSITSLSIWVVVLGSFGQQISGYTDHAVVQRFMTTKNSGLAAKSIWLNAIITVPISFLFFCIGTGLYSFYQSHPEKLDPTLQTDQILPTFIGAELPIGLAGLIVAGIFAAAQSTVSTSMNSTATTLVTDFMRPFNACRSEHGYLQAARALTIVMGTLGTVAGLLFIDPAINSLWSEYFKVIGIFMGALGGLFVLGFTTRKTNGRGALVGILTGAGVMIVVWWMQWANGYLFSTIGILICLLVGYLASLLLPEDHRDVDGLTIYTMRHD